MVVKIITPNITVELGMSLCLPGLAIVNAAASETVGMINTKIIVLIKNCIVIILSAYIKKKAFRLFLLVYFSTNQLLESVPKRFQLSHNGR